MAAARMMIPTAFTPLEFFIYFLSKSDLAEFPTADWQCIETLK
jgi:hypothetical protein